MGLWKEIKQNGKIEIHDDMGGEALTNPHWPQGMAPVTQAEADAILNPPKTAAQIKQEANQVILNQIEALEGKTERGVREFILASLEAQAVSLGAQQGLTQAESLAAAYASNILYRKAKDIDTAIDNLRKQLVWV